MKKNKYCEWHKSTCSPLGIPTMVADCNRNLVIDCHYIYCPFCGKIIKIKEKK